MVFTIWGICLSVINILKFVKILLEIRDKKEYDKVRVTRTLFDCEDIYKWIN